MSDVILETKGVKKSFGAVVAASDINIKVEPGARLSLIGANGAGKTTLVNIVTGYVKPTAGQILLAGRDITSLSPRRIARLGVCRSFQMPQLCETMTPIDNLLVAIGAAETGASYFSPSHSHERLERAHAILNRFGLDAYADRPVDELPGGVRKLVDIAMAMVRHPRVLLLDEPTSGVSSDEKFPLMNCIMAAIGSDDVAVIFVEHDMDIVTRYANRVLAFYSGEIIADDRPDEVLSDVAVQKYVTGTAR
jgi:branched-chain amino acid transport system ATP-binding protein